MFRGGFMDKVQIGKITHYFNKIGVAVIELIDELKVGDEISIEGTITNFTQVVESIQIEHTSIPAAKAGQAVGIKVKEAVKQGDLVFKVN